MVSLFTGLRRELAEREPETFEKIAFFDALLNGLGRGTFSDDEQLRSYVAELAAATDKENEYEHVSLEHRALHELVDALPSEHRLAPITERFGRNLRRIRKNSGLSQEALADRAGIHRTEASLLERGRREPELATMLKLAAALGVSLADLMDGIEWLPPKKADSRNASMQIPARSTGQLRVR